MQFTTLENTPPEYLLLGSKATQDYSADTFCLGLSVLHLLTGHEPYEELLKEVKCPPYLMEELTRVWSEKDSPYSVIKEVIDCLDTSDEKNIDPIDSCKNVFHHTLYRYVVLFGLPESDECWESNPIVSILNKTLAGDTNSSTRKASGRVMASRQYQSDGNKWSIKNGTQPIMSR